MHILFPKLKGRSSWFSLFHLLGILTSRYGPQTKKIAFATRRKLVQFNVMVYAELPATIRRHIESVFAGLHWDICFVHLDEIIVTRKTFEELLSNLRNASDRLKGAGLIIKPMAKDWCLFAFYVHLPWACNISKKNRNRCNQDCSSRTLASSYKYHYSTLFTFVTKLLYETHK